MPICSPGISQPRAGSAPAVIITAGVLDALFPGGPFWLTPFLGSLSGLITLELPTFCAVDPPADPVLTATDILNLVAWTNIQDYTTAAARVTQLIERYAWYVFCQCSTIATPTPPTLPSAPTGLPALNPPGLTGAPPAICSTESWSVVSVNTDTRREMRSNTPCDGAGQPTCQSLALPIPSGATAFQVYETARAAGQRDTNSSHFYYADVWMLVGGVWGQAGSLTVVDFGTFNEINSGTHSAIQSVPAGATAYAILSQTNTGGFPWTATATVNWYCGGGSLTPAAEQCCTATDPIVNGMLQQILSLVTLIQRNAVPFAYVPGASHAGLTGDGTLTIPSCIGVLVTITTVPGYSGAILGSPNEIFDIGWYSWGDSSGFAAREVIHKNPQQSFPPAAGRFTRLGYSLNPGVVATVQELYAET